MVGSDVEDAPRARRSARQIRRRRSNVIVATLAAAAATGGSLAGTHSTGTAIVDPLYAAAFAGAVTWACSRSARWTWMVLAAGAAALSRGWLLLPAAAGLCLAFASAFTERRRRVGALVGALASQVVLRWPELGFHGLTATLAAVVVGPCVVSAYRHLGRRARRRARLGAVIAAGAIAVLGVPLVAGALLARSSATHGVSEIRAEIASLGAGSTAAGGTALAQADRSFATASSDVGSWWSAGADLLPVLSQQRHALATATSTAQGLAHALQATQGQLDLQRLRYSDGGVDLAGVAALQAPLAVLDAQLGTAVRRLAGIRSAWLLAPVARRLDTVRSEIRRARSDVSLATQAVRVLPGLLGADGPRRYFVAFESPAESRGLGGLIGAYGVLTARDGRLRLTRAGQGAALRPPPGVERHITGPPDYLARYGQFDPEDNFQDLTYSPDLPTVASVIAQMYPQSGGRAIDGVLVLDPQGLAALLTLTGPIQVPGLAMPLTSANVAAYLDKTQFEGLSASNASATHHDDLLTALLRRAFSRLAAGSLPDPEVLGAILNPAVRQGHLLFWSLSGPAQGLLREVGLAGAFPATDGGDLLAVTTQNADNNKIDAYLDRTTRDVVAYDPATGATTSTVTVTLHNTATVADPPAAIDSYADSGLPLATNRTWLSLYSPLNLGSATEGGKPLVTSSGDELGVQVYSAYVDIGPGDTDRLVFHLHGLTRRGLYVLAVRRQPLINPDEITVAVVPSSGWKVAGSDAWTPGLDLTASRTFVFHR